MKPYSDSFLKHRTREELIEIIRCTEQNQQEAETALRQQYENTKDWEPVVHGHWITHNADDPFTVYGECSACGFEQSLSDKLPYCPNCGAKMDEVSE